MNINNHILDFISKLKYIYLYLDINAISVKMNGNFLIANKDELIIKLGNKDDETIKCS